MKRLVFTILTFIYIIFSFAPYPVAYATKEQYAIINEGCFLYADENLTEKTTSLPSSYFVTILSEQDDVFKVAFSSISGFVSSSSVSLVDYVPKSKYPTTNIHKVYNDGNTVSLRDKPSHLNGTLIQKLSDGETVTYFGTIEGSNQVEQLSSTWYYVRTNGENPVYGYVYSLYFSPPELPKNDTSPQDEPTSGQISSSVEFSPNGKYVVIVALCIPVVILLYILYKSAKRTPN